jgi:serine/threonine protein kinase
MPPPAPEDFWSLVAATRLVAPDALAALRREYASAPRTPAPGDDATTTLVKWLVKRGSLSKWQARRLLSGDRGPFFIGDYRLMERLECDGRGRLFRVRHEPSGRLLCLMLLDRESFQRPETWRDIVRRSTVAHDATDPVLSRTWALEQEQEVGLRFILCEDVEGPPLADELPRLGPLAPADACQVMLPLARGVAELHRRGVVHGGISLDAIRCEPAASGGVDAIGVPNGRKVRLLQFPLSGQQPAPTTAADATERIAKLGRRASFVPPESLEPGQASDPRGDVYSLGCVFHSLLTGVAPCWKGDAQRTLSQASTSGPEPLGPPRVPVEIATLVSYMVARDPAGRYPDAAEAADAIAACLGLPPVSTTLPPQQPLFEDAAADDGPTGAATPVVPADPLFPTEGRRSPAAASIAPSAANSRTRAGRRRLVMTAVGGGVVALALAAGLIAVLTRGGPAGKRPRADDEKHAASESTKAEKAAGGDTDLPSAGPAAEATASAPPANRSQRQTVVDSTDVPWASPTDGGPPSLAYLPPGSQLILSARPAEILASDEGRLFVRALGPGVERGIEALASLSGAPLDGVEEILGGWQAGEPGTGQDEVVGGWVVRLAEPVEFHADAQARGRAWGPTKPEKLGGETIYHGKAVSFWLPSAEEGRVLAMGPADLVRQMVSAAGEAEPAADGEASPAPPPGLTPDMETLVGMLDGTRHVILLGSPHYLLHDGRPVLAGGLARLVDPIGKFFGEGVKAAAMSLHFGDNFYVELDTVASRDEPARTLATRLAGEVDSWVHAVEDSIVGTTLHEYGRKLVTRLPTMIRVLAANVRCGAEGKGVVLNAYLPKHAGHNLVLASELALEQQAAGPAVAKRDAGPALQPKEAAGALGKLSQKMSLTFAKDTLEKSVQMIADEIGVPIEILGGDLQLEGITKNQSFGLEERDKTAEAVLRTILAKSDPAGRLVFVVRMQDGKEMIAVTTKAAAAKRGEKLPPGFEEQPAAEPAKGKKSK